MLQQYDWNVEHPATEGGGCCRVTRLVLPNLPIEPSCCCFMLFVFDLQS